MSIILRNVELFWSKLDPENPDMGFSGDKPQWNTQLRVRSKEQCDELKDLGFNPKVQEDDEGVYYKLSLRKDAVKKNGSANKPVPVFGRDMMPIEDVNQIGNGTVANVKVHSFDYNYKGKSGISFRLDAIQVVELVEYKSGSVTDGFDIIPEDQTSSVAGDDEESLY